MLFGKSCPECGAKMAKQEGLMKDLKTYEKRDTWDLQSGRGVTARQAQQNLYVRAFVCKECEKIDVIAVRNPMTGQWER